MLFPVRVRSNRNENIERAKVKSIQMTLVISLVFLLCWTPYYVMCIWYWTDPDTAKRVDQRVQKALFLFASTNSVVNPVVYGLFHMKSIFRPRTRSTIIVMRNLAHLENPTFSYELSYGSQSQHHNSSFRVARDEGWREVVPLLVSHDGANGNSYNNTL
ncbi:unnamed protein product [Orchesella dallaii]|uniref:G-protein coupled receptors family 1 profile domain-containing protein n=1 Tax=Orchesella dallaii TaxID=48710 RepID=A0ABP1S7C0_9HEXA